MDSILDTIVWWTNDNAEMNARFFEFHVSSIYYFSPASKGCTICLWSSGPYTEPPIIKRAMSGCCFLQIVRYLHVLEYVVPEESRSNRMFKVRDILEELERRFSNMFIQGQTLSLDETLVRA